MNAIAICGSPRKNGNTEQLLQRCLDKLREFGHGVELIRLADKTVMPCTGCGACRKKQDRRCCLEDDDFHDIFFRMVEADIIVVGSPVYFGSATPETMSLLDRAGYVARGNGNLFSRKLGGPLAVARRAGQNFTYAQLLYWFMIHEMVVPGSSYWNIAIAREPGDVARDEEALTTVDRFAENLAWLAGKLG